MRLHRPSLALCIALAPPLCAVAPKTALAVDAPAVPLLPTPESILEVKFTEFYSSPNLTKLDAASFKTLMGTAKLIPHVNPDKVMKERSMALWTLGSFTTAQGTYGVVLWLGGPGFIHAPDGRKGVFTYEVPSPPHAK